MQRALLMLAVVLTAACHSDSSPTAPVATTGILNFQIETKTCSEQGAFDISVFIDHVKVASPTFTVGSTSSFAVQAGTHTIGGFAVDGRLNWASIVVTVPAGGQYTALFACK